MTAFFNFVTHDWFFAVPMFLMSLTGLTLVIWRLLLNYNASVSMSAFLPVFQQKLEKEGVEGALRYCKSRTEIIPRRLYVAGLESYKQGLAAVRRGMANAIELEISPTSISCCRRSWPSPRSPPWSACSAPSSA